MPCQNITPVTVLPNFDGLPCQGTERFMSPICLVLQTGGWVRARKGGATRHSNTHDHWPISTLFVRSHGARSVWHIAFSSHPLDHSQLSGRERRQTAGPVSEFQTKASRRRRVGDAAMGWKCERSRETSRWKFCRSTKWFCWMCITISTAFCCSHLLLWRFGWIWLLNLSTTHVTLLKLIKCWDKAFTWYIKLVVQGKTDEKNEENKH